MQIVSKRRILPKRLLKCAIPICSSYLYARMNKRPRRQHSSNHVDESEKLTISRDVLLVDQLKSLTPGLIPYMTGFLATK